MEKLILTNGIELEVSKKTKNSYYKQLKALNELNKANAKLDANTPVKSVSATYSDYVLRALNSGAELLYFANNLSVVRKGDRVIAENRGFNKAMYYAIKKSIEAFNGKWCGDGEKKVFTYAFPTVEDGLKFVEAQKEYNAQNGK